VTLQRNHEVKGVGQRYQRGLGSLRSALQTMLRDAHPPTRRSRQGV